MPEAEAGHFLRALFLRYYLFLIIGSAAAALAHGRAAPSRPCSPLRLPRSTAAVLLLLVPKTVAFGIGNWQEMMLRAELLIEPTAYP